jgi:predicted secreted hydrolase
MKAWIWSVGMLGCVLSGAVAQEADAEGWLRAVEPRRWEFPRDHGAHPDYRTEWWYFVGNLADEAGRRFGYQLTFFRQGVVREPTLRASRWAVRDVYFAHFTVTDVAAGRFHFGERVARGALGGARVSERHMDLGIGSWEIVPEAEDGFRLRADEPGYAINLRVKPMKPVVFQGDRGLSQKAEGRGNASHYYALTRLRTEGTVRTGNKIHRVEGLSWLDREFSTSVLGEGQVGWDWFSIQLDSGEDLMLYQMRRDDGRPDPHSKGSWIAVDGTKTHLAAAEFSIEATGRWKSPEGTVYPSGWVLRVPGMGLELKVRPQVADQELRLNKLSDLTYWEGTCRVEGTRLGRRVAGYGYAELSGYKVPVGKSL